MSASPTDPVDSNKPLSGGVRRWTLIRDIVVFQGKLFLDGLRDLLLSPASLIAGLISLISPTRKGHRAFYDLLRVGFRMERWINLFGVVTPRKQLSETSEEADTEADGPNIDQHVERLEHALRRSHSRGGMTRAVKDKIDALIDMLQP